MRSTTRFRKPITVLRRDVAYAEYLLTWFIFDCSSRRPMFIVVLSLPEVQQRTFVMTLPSYSRYTWPMERRDSVRVWRLRACATSCWFPQNST
jgi:hypothetical protein